MIEVLVSMGVISVLLALLMPAVQTAREAARKMSCTNNLHQIGVAAHSFESVRGVCPGGSPLTTTNFNISAHVELLPYLDQQAVHALHNPWEDGFGLLLDPATSSVNQALLTKSIPAYLCPSDPVTGPRCNYRISEGTKTWWF